MSAAVESWFASRGWEPFDFQRETWGHVAAGRSALVHSATGTGKTLAAGLAPLAAGIVGGGLRMLWVTPLRALSADTAGALDEAFRGVGSDWRVEIRNGDTDSSAKAKQLKRMPETLVTTPETLSQLLSREDARERFAELALVVVDEWHELLGTKRGVQTELGLTRLRAFSPGLATVGLSATVGNLDEAGWVLSPGGCEIVRGVSGKAMEVVSLLPRDVGRFSWAGHYGTRMAGEVVRLIEASGTTLVFTNTRAMSEVWLRELLALRPGWERDVALHHGSLDRTERESVEERLRRGELRAVVCTSSLDLGVDFSPVDTVVQVGSPKGVARALQRAGRSGHRPGGVSRLYVAPTHATELFDLAAAREGVERGEIEAREPILRPLDVLAQHLVTVACGEGFQPEEMAREVRSTHAYTSLTDGEWGWCLDFVSRGGESLRAYPEYSRVAPWEDGRWRVVAPEIGRRHRMAIGTIVADASVRVRLMSGGEVGTVEETFVSRLRPGDVFLFGGRSLEFVRLKDLTAYARRAKGEAKQLPKWSGSRMSLTSTLSAGIRRKIEEAGEGVLDGPEMEALAPVLRLQARRSALPSRGELLIERWRDREGHHLFVFPFEGRGVHEGLAAVIAYRLSRGESATMTLAANDHGFEVLSNRPLPDGEEELRALFYPEGLVDDVTAALNETEMAKRRFREIAQIAGLTFPGFPGAGKSARQLQASSGLFFDVFSRYDPGNRLLEQAHREVLEEQMEVGRLRAALDRIGRQELLVKRPPRPTPFAFPILVERLRETVTSESLADRLEALAGEFEREADEEA